MSDDQRSTHRRLLSVIHGPVFGGEHNQMVRLREPLQARGWHTTGLGPTDPGSAAERVRSSGVEMVKMPLGRIRATADPRPHVRLLAGLAPQIASIRRLLRERSIDLVQVHGALHLHAALAAHLERVAVVWQLTDTRMPMGLRRAAMPVVVRLADAMTTWGRALADAYPGASALGERLIPIYPPVDASAFVPDPERRARARTDLGIASDAVAVGTVGNLNPSKGHEYLIRAAATITGRQQPLAVRIIGGHSPVHATYEASLRSEALRLGLHEPVLTFVDPGDRVAELMAGLDVFALTSVPRSEGMPTVIMEAMALGLPVIATDVGAVREEVDDGITGNVVAPEDPQALAGALGRLVADAQLRRKLGRAGRDRFLKSFDLDRLADRHLHAYEVALAHRAGRSRFGGA